MKNLQVSHMKNLHILPLPLHHQHLRLGFALLQAPHCSTISQYETSNTSFDLLSNLNAATMTTFNLHLLHFTSSFVYFLPYLELFKTSQMHLI